MGMRTCLSALSHSGAFCAKTCLLRVINCRCCLRPLMVLWTLAMCTLEWITLHCPTMPWQWLSGKGAYIAIFKATARSPIANVLGFYDVNCDSEHRNYND